MDAPDADARAVAPVAASTRIASRDRDWVQTWSRVFQRLLDKFLRETYGHVVSVQLLAAASTALLLSCALYFLSPLLEDDYHMYERYVPWVYYLDYSKYNSFIVDHVVVFLAISLPMGWLLLVNVTYSGVATRLDLALLLLRVACCLTVCASLTVILTEFLSRRVMIALLSLAYGALGLVYAWSVPLWRWYLDDASTKGLIAFLPASVQELLLRTSLLEWLTDTTLTERVQPFLPFLLPLSRAEQNRLLERMPVEQQLTLTRPGLLPFLPESVQRVLLPTAPVRDSPGASAEQQLVVSSADSSSSSSASVSVVTKRELPPTADAGFGFHRPDVVNSGALAKQSSEEVLADIISTRVWNGCKQIVQMPSSKTLNRTASVSTALFVLQLYASRKSRQMFVTTLQFLLTSALGSVAACAVLLRVVQLASAHLSATNRSVPLLRYAQQYLLKSRSAPAQLENSGDSSSVLTLRRAATSASVVLAVVVAMRKLRG